MKIMKIENIVKFCEVHFAMLTNKILTLTNLTCITEYWPSNNQKELSPQLFVALCVSVPSLSFQAPSQHCAPIVCPPPLSPPTWPSLHHRIQAPPVAALCRQESRAAAAGRTKQAAGELWGHRIGQDRHRQWVGLGGRDFWWKGQEALDET